MKPVICLLTLLLMAPGVFAQSIDPETVLATVNGEAIQQNEIDFTMQYFVLPQFEAQNPDQPMPEEQQTQIRQTLLNQAITERLVLQKGREAGITLDEQMVNTQFEALKAQRPNVPPEDLKRFLEQRLLMQTTIQQLVIANMTITDDELRAVYEQQQEQFNEPEQVRASHILISVAEDAGEAEKTAARQQIVDLQARARAGEDFAELARQYSNCPTNEKGGDLGFFPRGVMVPAFEEVAFSLETGVISDIVETPFGYHLIKVTEKSAEHTVGFEEVKDQLRTAVFQQKSNTEAQKWVSALRAEADIQFMPVQP